MTFDELRKLDLSDVVISATDLNSLVKECLSIDSESKFKDNEIILWVKAGIQDLKRQGIDAEYKIMDPLIRGAIVMFVKANFGMTSINEKKIAKEHYNNLSANLSLSSDYKKVEEDD